MAAIFGILYSASESASVALSSNRYPDFAVKSSPPEAEAAHWTARRGAKCLRRGRNRSERFETREGKGERESTGWCSMFSLVWILFCIHSSELERFGCSGWSEEWRKILHANLVWWLIVPMCYGVLICGFGILVTSKFFLIFYWWQVNVSLWSLCYRRVNRCLSIHTEIS